jgi:hypothetical protein
LTAKVSVEVVFAAKSRCDVGGHYSRFDILQLLVNKRPLNRVLETGESGFTAVSAEESNTDRAHAIPPSADGAGRDGA